MSFQKLDKAKNKILLSVRVSGDIRLIVHEQTGLPYIMLDERVEISSKKIAISTMHVAKGLEFKSVVVIACDDEVIPLQKRIEAVSDNSDRKKYTIQKEIYFMLLHTCKKVSTNKECGSRIGVFGRS